MWAVGPACWLGELARLAAGAVIASAAAARRAAARRGVQRSRERMFRKSTHRDWPITIRTKSSTYVQADVQAPRPGSDRYAEVAG
jgi:hypothetical protein